MLVILNLWNDQHLQLCAFLAGGNWSLKTSRVTFKQILIYYWSSHLVSKKKKKKKKKQKKNSNDTNSCSNRNDCSWTWLSGGIEQNLLIASSTELRQNRHFIVNEIKSVKNN